jgi:nucleotide-binding universal stress UspA family protein
VTGSGQQPGILVWFEDNPRGRDALRRAEALADARRAHLTVLTVAVQERLLGCARCVQGTALWNREVRKIASEELVAARSIIEQAAQTDFESVVGSPAEAIIQTAERVGAQTIVIAAQRRLDPARRRKVAEQLSRRGWQVISAP